jgi:hypothetical protein
MANRYPLVLDTTDGNKIKELPANDNLYLRNNSIIEVQDIEALGTINAARIEINGEALSPQSFLDLSDTPSTYTGKANAFVKVNSAGTALELVTTTSGLGNISVNNIEMANELYPTADVSGRVGRANARFFEIYAQSFIGDLKDDTGSIVFDSSTGFISYAAIFGGPSSLSEFTNDTAFVTLNDVQNYIESTPQYTDIVGSVFADDSTVLVDAINKTIPGYISIAELKSIVASSVTYTDFQTAVAAL